MITVKDIADEIVALQEKKNADYGNAFGISMQEFGLVAPAIRLTDKLNRFKSLIKKEAQVKTESIEDTLIDLAAYAMMTVAEMRNGKEEPTMLSEILKDKLSEEVIKRIPVNTNGIICPKDGDWIRFNHACLDSHSDLTLVGKVLGTRITDRGTTTYSVYVEGIPEPVDVFPPEIIGYETR